MDGVQENSLCYFVHSYYASLGEHTIATTDYTKPFSAALNKGSFYGVQFDTEKSAGLGYTKRPITWTLQLQVQFRKNI
jgi:glutamine amidotransferase